MKILILAANPRNDLNLDREIRDLKEAIEKSRNQQALDVVDALAVRAADLHDLLFKHQPQIVHFCGHGGGEQGLVFDSDSGREHRVRADALADLFRLFSERVECVVLNACYSQEQAESIVTHINYVFGMTQTIQDDAAIAFSKGFYRALGYARPIKEAYEFGCNAIQLEISGSSIVRSTQPDAERKLVIEDEVEQTPIPEHQKPILLIKNGLDISSRNPILPATRNDILLEIDRSLEDELTEDLDFDIHLKLVKIPRGRFWMGSLDEEEQYVRERPQHRVGVQSFWMSQYPITQNQWWAVAALPKVKIDLDPDPSKFKGDNLPVERVSWHEAVEFCDRLCQRTQKLYRLPSEAEWEYACRAGTTTPFFFGKTLSPDLANYAKNRGQTTEVGSFLPNAFGLYDMHGNVWEWCEDRWHNNYQGAPIDGTAWLFKDDNQHRSLRGGSWDLNPWFCRSAARFPAHPDKRDLIFGFRVVCSAPRTL